MDETGLSYLVRPETVESLVIPFSLTLFPYGILGC